MYGGYSGYSTGYPMSYGTTSYAPTAYGGYGGYGQAMSEDVVNDQLKDAQKVLKSQYDVQTEMLNHQQKAQLDILLKEKDRAIKTMSMQYEQQYTQQKLAIEQAHKCLQPGVAELATPRLGHAHQIRRDEHATRPPDDGTLGNGETALGRLHQD